MSARTAKGSNAPAQPTPKAAQEHATPENAAPPEKAMPDDPMREQLAQVDLAPLEELTAIQKDLDVLGGRLRTMHERKDGVADAVFERVRSDYEGKRAALEARAAPLRARGREQYARLPALLERCDSEHAAVALDREEVEFRFALGEFDQAEHKRRLQAVDAALRGKTDARAAAEALKARFVEAFGGEDALERHAAAVGVTGQSAVVGAGAGYVTAQGSAVAPPAAAAAAAPAPAPAEATVRLPVLDAAQASAAAPPAPPAAAAAAAAAGETQLMRAMNRGGDGKPPRADQTMILRTARLVPHNAAAGEAGITLALKPTSIGSGPGCDVQLPAAATQHAEVRVSMAGFTISDLGGGLRVNGVALQQHLLRHDDLVELGPAHFLFREG